MCTNEVIIKILGKTILEYPEINQKILRNILEEVLYEYDLQPKTKALAVISNMQDKMAMFITCKKLDGLSNITLKHYALHLRRFSQFINKNVEDVTTMDIRRFLAYLMQQNKLKETSLEAEKAILKSFFNWLEGERYIVISPARQIKPTKVEKRLREGLSVEELEILRESCETLRDRALVEFFYCTGCRLDEVEKLNKQDIDWQNLSVKVVGKGNKERVVYISEKAKLHIKKYLMSRLDDCEALFVTERRPYRRTGHRSIQRAFNKMGQRAGFKKSIHPHLMRHTTATQLINNGADLVTVQHILGHEDPSTTQIYAKASDVRIEYEYRKHLIQ